MNVRRCVSVSNACVLASGLVLSFFSGSVRAHLVFAMGMTTSHCALLLVSVRFRFFPFCEAYPCSFELSATFYFYISGFEFQAPLFKNENKKRTDLFVAGSVALYVTPKIAT